MYNTVSEEFCEYLLLEMEKMCFHAALEGVRVMELPSYYELHNSQRPQMKPAGEDISLLVTDPPDRYSVFIVSDILALGQKQKRQSVMFSKPGVVMVLSFVSLL